MKFTEEQINHILDCFCSIHSCHEPKDRKYSECNGCYWANALNDKLKKENEDCNETNMH